MDVRTERRLVTCLFVDVVGSTDTTMRIGPERMQRLLAEAFDEMSASIAGQGGTVEKYVGDAIFALFGAPVTHVDDAARALRAAEACVGWLSQAAPSQTGLAVRVGIETGEALVDLGAVDLRQRMAVGTCVNIAARLQQHAEPNEIIVGTTCYEATAAVANFESIGTLDLKGLGEVDAWRFTGFSRGAPAAIPFVGRDSELEVLRGAFQVARQGTATLALVIGPPGQGKSRLVAEAIGAGEASGPARVMEARCRPGAETGSNTPLRQLVTEDVPEATPDGVRRRLTALLGPEEGAAAAAAICHSAGLEADERMLAISRMEQRELIAGAWRRYLAAQAAEGPIALWIEDLHWADPVLLRVVDHVTADLDAPLLVVATARPEFEGTAHLRPGHNRLQIDLAPLEADAADQLARVAGDGSSVERAAGNPLFIIELARSRAEAGSMPLTIQAAIEARLDELAAPERDLLQRASVAGETFGVRDAALLAEREPAEVAGMLGRLVHLGFVAPVDSMYRFHHALVRDVAYGRLPVAQRMALHARYAVEGADPGDEEARAHHWWEAVRPTDAGWVWEDAEKLGAMRAAALRAHLAAGRRLEERNDYEGSLEVYERAVMLADEAGDRALAEAALGGAYARQARGDEAWEHRLRAIELYVQEGVDPPGELYADMLEIPTMTWGYFKHLPDDEEVLRLLDEGESTARASGDSVSLARLLAERAAFTEDVTRADEIWRFVDSPDAIRFADPAHRMAQVYLATGRIAQSMELYESVFERLLPQGAVINDPEAQVWYAVAAMNAGVLDRADVLSDLLIEQAARRSAHTRQHALGLRALLRLVRGDWDALTTTTGQLAQLVDGNPDASFCLLGSTAVGYGAIAAVRASSRLPEGLEALTARMVPESVPIQAGSVMVPKVMAGDAAALAEGLEAYAPDLRLRDRMRVWDVCDVMPAIAGTMLEDWDDLGASLERLDDCARNGGRLASAVAAAVREEQAAAQGGPAPSHDELKGLGFAGISQLLRYRPDSVSVAG